MTIKDLAFFTDKNKSTVGRWVAKCNSKSAVDKLQKATKESPADFTVDEVEEILNSSSMSKDAVLILMGNARGKEETKQIDSPVTAMMAFMTQMQKQNQEFMAEVLRRLDSGNTVKSQLQIKSAVPIKDRDQLRKMVNEYATKCLGGNYRDAWHLLYEEIYYRLKVNVRVRAKNTGKTKLDIIEDLGLIEQSYFIIIEKMGE